MGDPFDSPWNILKNSPTLESKRSYLGTLSTLYQARKIYFRSLEKKQNFCQIPNKNREVLYKTCQVGDNFFWIWWDFWLFFSLNEGFIIVFVQRMSNKSKINLSWMIFLIAINMLRSKNFSIEIMDFDFNSLSRSQFRNTSQVLLCFHLGQIQLLENLYISTSAYKPKSEKKILASHVPRI